MQSSSGADLVREALRSARTPAERELVHEAAARASFEVASLSLGNWGDYGTGHGLDPITTARRLVVAELHAAATSSERPQSRAEFANLFEQLLFEEELETTRRFATDIVRLSLPPPAE